MQGRFTFFGTSASMGIPTIGCNCSVCLSDSPLNKRMRSSALLQINQKRILIDVGPDFRTQALQHRVDHLDGVIITHTHYDHIAGIDDLRAFGFYAQKPLPILASEETLQDLKKHYYYLKESEFAFHSLKQEQSVTTFLEIPIRYCFYKQTGMGVTGYRFGDLAFITDIKEYSSSVLDMLQGCEILIISALDWEPTKAHLGIHEVIELAQKVKVRRVILTHIGHELDHESTNAKLPKFMELAYDGMSVEWNL